MKNKAGTAVKAGTTGSPAAVKVVAKTASQDAGEASDASLAQAMKGQLEKAIGGEADPEHDPEFDDPADGGEAVAEETQPENEQQDQEPGEGEDATEETEEQEDGDDNAGTQGEEGAEGEADSREEAEEGEAGEEAEAEEAEEDGEETEGEEGEESESEEEDEAQESKRRDWPKSAQKRVNKLTAKLKEAQAKLAEVEAEKSELESAKAQAVPVVPGAQFGSTPAEQQLANDVAQKQRLLEKLEAIPEGGELDFGEEGKTTATAEQVRSARNRITRDLTKAELRLEAMREQRNEQGRQVDAQARQEYPWLKDKTSTKYQRVQNALGMFPWLRQMPGHLAVLADVVEMQEIKAARTAALKAKKEVGLAGARPSTVTGKPVTAKPKVPAVKAAVTTKSKPLPAKPGAVNESQRMQKFLESGDPNDAKSVLEGWLSRS